jgi:hypothetical protein
MFFCLCEWESESIAVLKEYSIASRCNSKHKENYKNCVGALIREKWLPQNGSLSHNNSLENNQMTIPLHCGKVSCRSLVG